MSYNRPRLLERDDSVKQFVCRSQAQTNWLLHAAHNAAAANTSKVFVVTDKSDGTVVACCGWCMTAVPVETVTDRWRAGTGRYPLLPAALLTRLGVHRDHERRGLGSALLSDVLRRTAELGEQIGCRGLVIHAESENAREFYMRVAEFEALHDNPNHLVLLMKDIRKSLASEPDSL